MTGNQSVVRKRGSRRVRLGRSMQKREQFLLLAILTSSACGGRSELDGLSLSSNIGGLSSSGSTSSASGSPSTGGTTNTGATTCPSTAPQTGDQCLTVGLFCVYPTSVCPLGYQCSTSGEFERVYVPCFSDIGGTTSTGGSPASGGSLSSSGGTNTSAGATSSTGGIQGTGCTGNFEMILGNKGLCVAKMAPITGPPSDAGSLDYKIDMTEVTKGQYDDWLASNPVLPASTDLNCGYVRSYAEQGTGYSGPDADHHPVVYVDWCDAHEYCLGVEKPVEAPTSTMRVRTPARVSGIAHVVPGVATSIHMGTRINGASVMGLTIGATIALPWRRCPLARCRTA